MKLFICLLILNAFGCFASCKLTDLSSKQLSEGLQFFKQNSFFSLSDYERQAAKAQIPTTDHDLCTVKLAFHYSCLDNNPIYDFQLNTAGPDSDRQKLSENTVIQLASNIRCGYKETASIVEDSKSDCASNPNSTYCGGGEVIQGEAGQGKVFTQKVNAKNAGEALQIAFESLNDNNPGNEVRLGYGDLLYKFENIKSPHAAQAIQEQNTQNALLSLIGCNSTSLENCTKEKTPAGELVLRKENPDSPMQAIEYMNLQNACTNPLGQCTKLFHIGFGDLKNYYSVKPNGKTLQQELRKTGGLLLDEVDK